MNKNMNGVFSVLMTPFVERNVDHEAFEKQVIRLKETGVSGYVVNGSTAEFIYLSKEEKKRLVEIVADNREEGKKIIVSACESNLADAYEICCHAETTGADAVLVCPPYYFKYKQEEIKAYYKELADGSPLPVIMYNIPFFTQELELAVVYECMRHPNIIGIKDSSGNMKRIMHLIDVAGDTPFSVMTGTDDMLYPAYFAGCTGSMTAFATIYPNKVCDIYDSIHCGDYEHAKEVQSSLMADLRLADSETFPIGYKRLMEKVSGITFGNKEMKKT